MVMTEETTVLVERMPRLLRLDDVKDITGLSRTAIYSEMSKGKFPQSYRLTERAVGWKLCEINEWADKLQPVAPTQE